MPWYFVFFLVSGFSSLIYQVVWLRQVMAEFGVTTPSISIVLSVFMAGLGLGSWGAGHLADRLAGRSAVAFLRLYGLTELVIGVAALAVPDVLSWGHELLARAGTGIAWASSAYYLASGSCITLALLPPCLAMGATVPVAMAGIRRSFPKAANSSFSFLYLANVLGATCGTLASAFVLIEVFGLRGTVNLAALLNVLLAVATLAVSLAPWPTAPRAVASPGSTGATAEPGGPLLLWGLFATGFISLAMEVVWTRQFTPYLGTVVYAFASILAVYLAATFIGSQIYRASGGLAADRTAGLGLLWMTVGLAGLIPLVASDPRLGWQGLFRVAVGIAPFCGALGFVTPMLVDRWSAGAPGRAGLAYAINVAGCIAGPLAASFALLPRLGERWSLFVLILPLLATGLVALGAPRLAGARAGLPPRAAALVFAVALAAALLIFAVSQGFEERFARREVRRDHTATVIATGEGVGKRMLINGVGITSLTPITKMMAHLPLAFLDRPPRDGLAVAFGMGTSFRSLLSWDIPVTAVELVPSVPALFGYYHADGPERLRSPLARVVIDDGRRFLERSPGQYDVITIDPPPPVEAVGSSLLYSREFYRVARKRLRPDGILQQWLPGGEPVIITGVARALAEAFPHVRAYRSLKRWGFHFLASAQPIPTRSGAELARRLPPAAVADLLEWGPYRDAAEQFDAVVRHEVPMAALLVPGVPAIEDDRPLNEYFAVRRGFANWW